MKLDGSKLVLERAVASAIHLVQADAWRAIATGTMTFRDLAETRDVELAVSFDLQKEADLERLHLYREVYVAGEPGVGVPILRVEATLRFDVWRLVAIETTE